MANDDCVLMAVSDRHRRAILTLLKEKPLTAGQLAAQFAVSWPAISRHLRVLRLAGLVTVERKGRTRRYFLNPLVLREALNDILEIAGGPRQAANANRSSSFQASPLGREAVS